MSVCYGQRATEILTSAQKTRLQQVTFQLRGVDAFFTADINKLLGIDGEQRKHIDRVQSWLIQGIHDLHKTERTKAPGRQVSQTKLSALRQQAEDKITSVLKSEQRDRLSQLRGTPITFSAADLSMLLRERAKAKE